MEGARHRPRHGKTNLHHGADRAGANYKALEFELGKDRKARIGKTVGEAIDDYIALKDGVLSPTTIQGYRKIRRVSLQGLMDIPVKNLTQQQVQAAINEECKRVSPRTGRRQSPKSIHNMHGLLSAALSLECPDFVLRTTLPAKQKRLLELPPAADVIRASRGRMWNCLCCSRCGCRSRCPRSAA